MQGPRRRAAILAATLCVAGLAALPQAALADVLAPDSPASGSASASRTIYVIMAILSIVAFVAVLAAIVRAVRSSRGRAEEPERRTRAAGDIQRRVGMGLGAAVGVLFVVGIIFTEKARDVEASETGAEPIAIKAFGQQWLWRYEYPLPDATELPDGYSSDIAYSYHDLVVPVDTPITLTVSSIDVLHRWTVPALGRPVDAVPGDTNVTTFTADEVGTYEGRSTRFSGPGYSAMTTTVEVVSQDEYEAFLEELRAGIKKAREAIQSRVDDGTAPGVELR